MNPSINTGVYTAREVLSRTGGDLTTVPRGRVVTLDPTEEAFRLCAATDAVAAGVTLNRSEPDGATNIVWAHAGRTVNVALAVNETVVFGTPLKLVNDGFVAAADPGDVAFGQSLSDAASSSTETAMIEAVMSPVGVTIPGT